MTCRTSLSKDRTHPSYLDALTKQRLGVRLKSFAGEKRFSVESFQRYFQAHAMLIKAESGVAAAGMC